MNRSMPDRRGRYSATRTTIAATLVGVAAGAASAGTAFASTALAGSPPMGPSPEPASTPASTPVSSTAPTPPRHESRSPAVTPASVLPTERSTARAFAFGGFEHVQVNVGPEGDNIVGDAGNEPSIAVDPTAPNRLVVGWRQFDSITSSFRQAGFSRSVDGGRTWAPLGRIEPGIFRSDPVLQALDDGRILYLSLEVTPANEFTCDVFVSFDGGETWPQKTFAFGGDKSWIVADLASDGPGAGRVYQAWNWFGNMFQPGQVNAWNPDGPMFAAPVPYTIGLERRPIFGQNAVGPDGALHVGGWEFSLGDNVFTVATSPQPWLLGGPIFTQFSFVELGGELGLSIGPNPGGLLGQVEIAVDHSKGPRHGWIYLLASIVPDVGDDPMDVIFVRSEDGGVTWTEPVRVNDDPAMAGAWNWMGTMGVSPDGRIDVVWVDTRDSLEPNLGHLRTTSSSDGGTTWAPSIQVGPEFDSFVGWPQQEKIGDYFEVVSDQVGADVIYAATYNGEQDVYYLRLGARDCNGNGVADADDLVAGTETDCDGDGIPDACAIAAGAVPDRDGDGIPDTCLTCAGDLDVDGMVGFTDLQQILANWGPCDACAADLDGDGTVGLLDLLTLLASWGPCDPG